MLLRFLASAAAVAVLCFLLPACDQAPAPPASIVPVAVPTAASDRAMTPATKAALAAIGRLAFFDASLSASGQQSCSSCHDPAHAYGPPNGLAVQRGGPDLQGHGTRAVPSLRYLRRTPIWFKTFVGNPRERLTDTDNVPVGGFSWDGRFNTMAAQAASPLLAANEMANASIAAVVQRLSQSAYADQFRTVFGADIFTRPTDAFAALGQALQRFQLDDPSFQPYSSKFDAVLDGKALLTAEEQHGFDLFKDRERGNCAACHLVEQGANGAHPLLTDFSFAAIGVPRNPEIPANADPDYYDLGLCGPLRTDQRAERPYCGMFKTPSLRNVATRGAFFHNGRFHTLEDVLRFYVQRDARPEQWYPHPEAAAMYDDLPAALQGNVDHIDPPLTQKKGDQPVWNAAEIRDVVAFLKTLTDADAESVRP